MTNPQARTAIDTLLQALVRPAAQPGWDDWIPLVALALTNQVEWVTAVQTLRDEDQYELLNALRSTPGPFADALVLLTARHAQEIEDPQVRDFLLTDAVEAGDRRLALMVEHRDMLQQLVGQLAARQTEHYDLAQEVAELERKLSELRAADIDTERERVHTLEREVTRLETFRRSLERYNAAEREAYRADLDHETQTLVRERERVEQDVARALAERDTAQRMAAEATDQLTAQQSELESLRAKTAAITQRIADSTAELHQLRADRNARADELAALDRERAELNSRIAEDSSRLQELRTSPSAQLSEQLAQKVNEVFALLPPDVAERAFPNQLTSRRNG